MKRALFLALALVACGGKESSSTEIEVRQAKPPATGDEDYGAWPEPMPPAEMRHAERSNRVVLRDMQERNTLADNAERGDAAIKAMVAMACIQLIAIGRQDLCAEFEGEYAQKFDGYLGAMVALEDLGDHTPLSLWLAVFTDTLQLVLGDRIMELTHLDDLRIMNYAIPVVFRPQDTQSWCIETQPGNCRDEYRLHFVPFAGTCAFWVAEIACTAATWGTGIFLICSPIGVATEWLTRRYIAPRLSNAVYDRANQSL